MTVKPEPPRPPIFDPADLTAPDLPAGPTVGGGPVEPDILVSSNSQADAVQVAQQAQTLGLTLISQDALNSLNIGSVEVQKSPGSPKRSSLGAVA